MTDERRPFELIKGGKNAEPKMPQIEQNGELSIEEINEGQIPVNIALVEKDGTWYLNAACYYTPARIVQNAFKFSSKDLPSLQKIVREKIMPLYRNVLQRLSLMADAEPTKSYDSTTLWDAPK